MSNEEDVKDGEETEVVGEWIEGEVVDNDIGRDNEEREEEEEEKVLSSIRKGIE